MQLPILSQVETWMLQIRGGNAHIKLTDVRGQYVTI